MLMGQVLHSLLKRQEKLLYLLQYLEAEQDMNADESLVFWEHQGELTITKDGKDIYKGNIVQNQ